MVTKQRIEGGDCVLSIVQYGKVAGVNKEGASKAMGSQIMMNRGFFCHYVTYCHSAISGEMVRHDALADRRK